MAENVCQYYCLRFWLLFLIGIFLLAEILYLTVKQLVGFSELNGIECEPLKGYFYILESQSF